MLGIVFALHGLAIVGFHGLGFSDRLKVEKIHELWPLLWYCLTIESAVFVVLVVTSFAFVCASCITSYQQNHNGKYDDSDVIVERL